MLLSLENDIINANAIKEVVLQTLLAKNIISDDDFKEYSENWKILIYKKSWFQKLTSTDKNYWYYKFFKLKGDGSKENITLS